MACAVPIGRDRVCLMILNREGRSPQLNFVSAKRERPSRQDGVSLLHFRVARNSPRRPVHILPRSLHPRLQRHRMAKAPTKGLSTLNSMAFGLAVYASRCGLPQRHARLASSCSSDSTGRAFHPQASDEWFQIRNLPFLPSLKLAWRNRLTARMKNSRRVSC